MSPKCPVLTESGQSQLILIIYCLQMRDKHIINKEWGREHGKRQSRI